MSPSHLQIDDIGRLLRRHLMGRTCINDHHPEHSLGNEAWHNQCAQCEIERLRGQLAEWEKLRDPATLHTNLVRGFPAALSRESLLHLAGADQLLNALEEADRLLDHCDEPTEWRERWAHLFEREPHTQQGETHD